MYMKKFIALLLVVLPVITFAQSPTPTQALTVTCNSTALNGAVEFNAQAQGGTGTYTYSWQANGAVATSSLSGNNSSTFTFPVATNQTPETALVTVADGQNIITGNCPQVFPIIQPIVGYCTVEVLPLYYNSSNTTVNGRTIRFRALVGGGTGTYTYTWNGTDNLSGNTQDITQVYTTAGLKTGTVTVVSGTQSAQLTCSANLVDVTAITDPNRTDIGGSCTLSSQTPSTQSPVTWTATTEGLSTSSVAWSGDEIINTATSSTNSSVYTLQYTSLGLKTANLSLSSTDGTNQNLTMTCQALVASSTVTTTATNGCFIATAAWGTQDAPEVVALRKFRDDDLLTTTLGSDVVNAYYSVSPSIADVIRDSNPLKYLVRILLKPIVYVAQQIDQKQ
jgi:hypothetical protein